MLQTYQSAPNFPQGSNTALWCTCTHIKVDGTFSVSFASNKWARFVEKPILVGTYDWEVMLMLPPT